MYETKGTMVANEWLIGSEWLIFRAIVALRTRGKSAILSITVRAKHPSIDSPAMIATHTSRCVLIYSKTNEFDERGLGWGTEEVEHPPVGASLTGGIRGMRGIHKSDGSTWQ